MSFEGHRANLQKIQNSKHLDGVSRPPSGPATADAVTLVVTISPKVILGSSLEAIEIGNEPDLYSTYKSNPAQYPVGFAAYVTGADLRSADGPPP